MKKNVLLTGALLAFGIVSNAQWVTQNTGFPEAAQGINDICIVNPSTVWATAFDGSPTQSLMSLLYTKTINGGTTWVADSMKTAPVNTGISNIYAISKDTAWACLFGDNSASIGGIFRTNDGGTTWAQQSSATFNVNSFPDWVYFFDKNNGVAFGDPNPTWEIYTTSNGGTTWTADSTQNLPAVLTGEYGNTAGFEVAGSTVYCTTNMGQVLKSTDMGKHWTASTVSAGVAVNRIAFKDANNGIVAAGNMQDSIFKTTNGGAAWTYVPYTGRFLFDGLCYSSINGGVYIATGDEGAGANGTSYSADGGATWMTQDTTDQHIAVEFVGSTGWAGGFNNSSSVGGIYKWTGTMFAVEEQHQNNGSMLVSPNPNNGIFQITLNNLSGKQQQVAIYDLLGNSIYQSADNAAGNQFRKSVDLSTYPTGMYLIRVLDGENVYTAKVIHQ